MPYCKWCDEPIAFSDDYVSESGKKIPLDEYSGEPHDCPDNPYRRSRIIECWNCGEEITFSDDMISKKSGKKIPLDPETYDPHKCPEPEPEEEDLRKER